MGPLEGHADLARLQKGKSAGFFSIAYVCVPYQQALSDMPHFVSGILPVQTWTHPLWAALTFSSQMMLCVTL